MRILNEPYFLLNKTWYYYDKEESKFKLTKEGLNLKKVKESYDEFYELINGGKEENEGD
jgi:hypothetical protein